ncbi:hypothetical protein [Nocardioides sp. LS1]|uniref:hypothetical protein n=1 Tax=Nocardioides sp. LS1 TaxID=1027620 RepID=UPI000F6253DF|nr:hypothetical protein [Nocardioides sp. LS1]GCD89379.1 hypothetical protein NLS1_13850 [Nocardioides sp. LS1]
MPTGSPRTLLAVALLLAALSGCSQDAPAPAPGAGGTTAHSAPDVVRGITRALHRRAEAIRDGDEAGFLAGLARQDDGTQQAYFGNLQQLPLERFDYVLDPASVVRDGHDYWATVDVRLQLEGYDAVPVTSPDRYLFAPVRRHPGRFALASVTDAAWEQRNHVRPEPWDVGPIQVRTADGVLGIFDDTSVDAAPALLASVETGLGEVGTHVPYDWPHDVVVYALSDDAFLTGIEDLPGGDPETLDGVAFPVRARPDGGPIASTRFALNPRLLDAAGPARDRLVRHELTHVAVGEHDDHAPVWLSEGLAEWVSVQPLAPEERRIAPAAVDAAEAGLTDLPADDSFNDDDSAVHYATAWWACEYLAGTYGEGTLWSLLDLMDAPGADPDRVLRDQVGITTRELARKAGKLIVATYSEP